MIRALQTRNAIQRRSCSFEMLRRPQNPVRTRTQTAPGDTLIDLDCSPGPTAASFRLVAHWPAPLPFRPWPTHTTPLRARSSRTRARKPTFVCRFRLALGSAPFRCGLRSAIRSLRPFAPFPLADSQTEAERQILTAFAHDPEFQAQGAFLETITNSPNDRATSHRNTGRAVSHTLLLSIQLSKRYSTTLRMRDETQDDCIAPVKRTQDPPHILGLTDRTS